MHFHLPKPLHGWREFAGEVGIIVFGVLIALGAEQVVERVHDDHVAAVTLDSLKHEIEMNLTAIYLRQTAEPCIDRRLAELRQLFADWQTHGTFKTPLWVAQAPSAPINLTRYDAALSAGRLAQLTSEEQYELGSTAGGFRRFIRMDDDELVAWGRLRALQVGAGALSAGDRTQLRMALQDASTMDYRMKLMERQILPAAARHGFHPDFTEFKKVAADVWRSGRYTPSICVGIDVPPDQANELSGQVVHLSQ